MIRTALAIALASAFAAEAAPPVPPGTVTVQLGKGQVPADVKITKRKTSTSKTVLITGNPDWTYKILEYTEMHGGINADLTRVSADSFSPGWDTERVRPTTEQPSDSSSSHGGAFRVSCMEGVRRGPASMAFDDPIVFPAQPGRSHLHTFFGNTGANGNSTTESLLATGNSTCRGGTLNRSVYWVPTMIDLADNSPVVPDTFIAYYKTTLEGYKNAAGVFVPDSPQPIIQELPKGLRMIAGSPTRMEPRTDKDAFDYRYTCLGGPGGSKFYSQIPTDCPVGAQVLKEVLFPPCWDGKNIDSPDHKSHMAYKVNVKNEGDPRGWTHAACPATHPVRLPEITFNVGYTIKDTIQASRWALSCDTNVQPGGIRGPCLHGDWWNGWKEQPWIACLRNQWDCHAHLLGDGRETY